jgi:putative NADH-flavin reductase
MKLTLFGPTGGTGRVLIEQALAAGHDVTAFARTPSKITTQHPRLTIMQGDIHDTASVQQAVMGADAVLSALGAVRGGPNDILATGAQNIIAAMQKHNVRRLVFLTGAGVKQPQDPPSVGSVVMIPLMKLLSPNVLADAECAVDAIQKSNLDWTIIRAPRLGDNPQKGTYRTGYLRPAFEQVSRADVAAFMLSQLTNSTYLRQTPMITY